MAKIRDVSTYLGQHLTANDYYCEHESVTGQWVGRAAERLGLSGEIRAGDVAFENRRNNRLPDGGGKLTPRDRVYRIRFYNFQCSAPKSVSIMPVMLGDEQLLAAHDHAAGVAFAELEKFAATQANTIERLPKNLAREHTATFLHVFNCQDELRHYGRDINFVLNVDNRAVAGRIARLAVGLGLEEDANAIAEFERETELVKEVREKFTRAGVQPL